MSYLNKISKAAALLTALLCLSAPAALALPDDQLQPIKISADKAVRDEKKGLTIYSGNVRMQQGTLSIQAERITIYRLENEGDRIVAEGSPAQMQQQPAPDQAPVEARAGVIEYLKAEDRVHLRVQARIEQDGSIVTGETIDYLITERVVRANSDQAEADSRVEVVIPARTVQQAQQEDSDATPASE